MNLEDAGTTEKKAGYCHEDDRMTRIQERIENIGDNADLQEVYDTERRLLYVACTRA
jgi:ATP-dependent exoDNAse (exonuclease V) beta subunit